MYSKNLILFKTELPKTLNMLVCFLFMSFSHNL